MKNEIINKLNNEIFIFRNIQFWYENCDDVIYHDILRKFIQSIFDDVFYNISVEDLEKLLQAHKDKRLYNKFYQSEPTKKILDILYQSTQEIQKITNKNVDKFLGHSYEIIEDVIY